MLEIIAKKIGMTHSFRNNGSTNAITLIKIYDNIIIDVVKNDHDNKIKIGYEKVQNTKNINKILNWLFQ